MANINIQITLPILVSELQAVQLQEAILCLLSRVEFTVHMLAQMSQLTRVQGRLSYKPLL